MIDELDTHGALRADLAQFYGLNIDHVWAGTLPAHHVVMLSEHLSLNPQSRVFAIRGGSPELQGWDQQTVILARLHNLIAGLIAGLSNSGADLDGLYIDHPGAKSEPDVQQPQTIAEFSITGFNRFMYEKG